MNTSGSGVPSVLAGRYLIGAELGQGGMAVVMHARDTVLHRDVAVKLLHSVLVDAGARDRFQIEGETLAGLHHPGLVTVFDAGVDNARPYLVMELVEGQTLAARCRCRPLAPAEVQRIGVQLAAALDHVHRHGVAHRDVKPGNVLLGADGRVRLADFGVARVLDSASTLTEPGTAMGTPAYLAPEQVRGEAGTTAVDVYALGLVLLEALRGRPAYSGLPHVAAYARLVTPPATEGIPDGLRQVLAQMTGSDPASRPSARQVEVRLRALGEGGPAGSAPPAITEELPAVPAFRASGPVRRAVVAAAVVVLVGGGAIGAHQLADGGSRAPAAIGVPTAAPSSTGQPATTAETTARTGPVGPAAEPVRDRKALDPDRPASGSVVPSSRSTVADQAISARTKVKAEKARNGKAKGPSKPAR